MRPMEFSYLVTNLLRSAFIALQCVIAFMIFRQRLSGQFPLFFSYLVVVSARDLALLFLPYNGYLYSYVYWPGEAAAILLSLGAVFETVWHLIRPFSFLRTLILRSFWIIAAIAALGMLLVPFLAKGTEEALFTSVILWERAARVLQVCLMIALTLLMSRLGLTWHHYSLGIVAGFGIYSALDLALLELRAHLHAVSDATFVLLHPAAYNLAVIIWAFYFLSPRAARSVERLPSTDLAKWNDALSEYVNQWYRRS